MDSRLEEDRKRLARLVRDEMQVLKRRVMTSAEELEKKTDEEIARGAGYQLPQFGQGLGDLWFAAPLENARRALTALAAMNRGQALELEKQREREKDQEAFGAGLASP